MTLKNIKNFVFSCYWIRIIPADRQGLFVFRICGHRLRSHQDVRLGVLRDRKERLPGRLAGEFLFLDLIDAEGLGGDVVE